MLTLTRLLLAFSWFLMLLIGYHPSESSHLAVITAITVLNLVLIACIGFDLGYLVFNALDAEGWTQRHPSGGLDALDLILCLLWSCLTLTPYGLFAILTDGATKLFSRWAQALQESHA
jgi:hypothetical protein